ncbi:hypothetical protein B5M09_003317 [Aphanomyces astaci]|uniref:Zeta toxin domain-containing protein n=1 Tax=Aphanomyces astaci TaxID=112090 RepID=A0A3R7YHB9_APHAT|nr:hypothetical protein B5M09_003317 [Aphanomyces astaci]
MYAAHGTGSGGTKTTEEYTRYRLQETLTLMGCRRNDAITVTGLVFAHYHAHVEASAVTALPWTFQTLQQCVYAELAKLEYTKPTHLLDFDLAKEITQRNTSFVVLLGGTSGTGKSTLASLLASRLRLTTVLPTDSVRHISRAFMTKEQHPCAFTSTYQAGDALTPAQVDELATIATGDMNTIMSDKRLHKRKVLKGYTLQSDAVLEKLDLVLTMFAVRAKHMTVDPQENKYIKYFDNIRIIQRHLCKNADKFLIPKVDNTNVDRSLVTIQTTLIRALRKQMRDGTNPDVTFESTVAEMKLRWRRNERSRSWLAPASPTSPFAKGSMSVVYDASTRATLANRKATRLRPSSSSPKKQHAMRRQTAIDSTSFHPPSSPRRPSLHRAMTMGLVSSPPPSVDFDSVSVAADAIDDDDDMEDMLSDQGASSPLASSPLERSVDGECRFELSSESGLDDDDDDVDDDVTA